MSVRKEEVQAALEARRELGPEYEDHIADALLEKIERRLEERKPVPEQAHDARSGQRFVVALVSLGCGIPITGIAATNGGLAALLIVWAGIVLVNLALARR